MKPFIAILFALTIILQSCSSPEITDSEARYNELPKELRDLPTGIEIEHSKSVVYAEINEEDPETRGKYKWHYETTVKSTNEDLTIIEFGACIWTGDNWSLKTIYGRPFNNEEFAKWYSCPDGELIKGKDFTDFNNWSKGNTLDGKTQMALWYYIGENKNGEKFKGVAEITTVYKFEE